MARWGMIMALFVTVIVIFSLAIAAVAINQILTTRNVRTIRALVQEQRSLELRTEETLGQVKMLRARERAMCAELESIEKTLLLENLHNVDGPTEDVEGDGADLGAKSSQECFFPESLLRGK